MTVSVCPLALLQTPNSTVGWISMTFCTHIPSPQRINPTNVNALLTFFYFLSKYAVKYVNICIIIGSEVEQNLVPRQLWGVHLVARLEFNSLVVKVCTAH